MYACTTIAMESVPVEDISLEEQSVPTKFNRYIKLVNNSSKEQFFNYTDTSKMKHSLKIMPQESTTLNLNTVRSGLTSIPRFSWHYDSDEDEFHVMQPTGKSSIHVGDNANVLITVTFNNGRPPMISLSKIDRTMRQ